MSSNSQTILQDSITQKDPIVLGLSSVKFALILITLFAVLIYVIIALIGSNNGKIRVNHNLMGFIFCGIIPLLIVSLSYTIIGYIVNRNEFYHEKNVFILNLTQSYLAIVFIAASFLFYFSHMYNKYDASLDLFKKKEFVVFFLVLLIYAGLNVGELVVDS
jgi:hypothetical protein